MTEQSEVTLLPCPFCGGEADVESETCGWRVKCIERNCYTAGPWPDDCTEAEAIAAWNTRSQPSDDELLREALVALLRLSDAADEVNGAIDAQTYDEKRKLQDWPDDCEFDVTLTAKQESALNAAIVAAQKYLRDAALATTTQPDTDSGLADKMTRSEVKALWVEHGGSQHGPMVEHYRIEEQAFYRFATAFQERTRARKGGGA